MPMCSPVMQNFKLYSKFSISTHNPITVGFTDHSVFAGKRRRSRNPEVEFLLAASCQQSEWNTKYFGHCRSEEPAATWWRIAKEIEFA